MAIITGPEHPPITIASAPGRSTVRVRPPESISIPTDGTGELSSQFPGALTTVEGVPVSAQVLVRYRAPEPGGYGDGVLVATTTSSPAGEWELKGINAKHRYDISARYIGENDALQSNVSPFDLPRFRPNTVQVPIGVPLDMPLPIVGGKGEVTAVYVSGSYPAGVSLVNGRLVGSWPTGATGSYPLMFNLTDDEGTVPGTLGLDLVLLPMSLSPSALPELAVGTPVSVPFNATGGEGPYTYAVTSGTLPAGLSLNGSTGVLSGTPAVGGPYSFEITATDTRSTSKAQAFSGAVSVVHAYWRVLVSTNNGYAYTNLVELMFDGAQATGGSPVFSSQYDATWSAEKAFDGVVAGDFGWSSVINDIAGAYIGYAFAAPRSVGSVTIVARTSGAGLTGMPKDFAIQSSDDGATWTTEWSVTGQTGWTANETRTFTRP